MADSTFGYTYSSFQARSPIQCCAQCFQDSNCKSVNYFPANKTCGLKSMSPTSLLDEIYPYVGNNLYYRQLLPCDESWNQFNDHCYIADNVKRSWSECQSFCKANGGANLTSITSSQENEFVRNLANTAGLLRVGFAVWIGMNAPYGYAETMSLTWSDDSIFEFTNFNDGEPNGYQTNVEENCLEMGSDGTWNDKGCDIAWPCVCKLKMLFA